MAHPVSYPVGNLVFFTGEKQLIQEAEHSSSSSVEVQNTWRYISILPHV
jgi:hypothetical protein